jgi:hypothetical protein
VFLAILGAITEEAQALPLALLQPENGDLDGSHVRTRGVVAHDEEQGARYRHVWT